HMNGRIYDPSIGRFLQADPVIENLTDRQSLNRYSYLRNNPLNATDPTGFSRFSKFIKQYGVVLLAVALAGVTVGIGSLLAGAGIFGAAAGAIAGAVTGFIGGFAATGSLLGAIEGAAIGSLFGSTFGAIGAADKLDIGAKIFIKVGVAGVQNIALGGKFGHGFASTIFSTVFSPGNFITGSGNGHRFARSLIAAATGGSISKLTGGKFANGAVTSFFAHLFNTDSPKKEKQKQVMELSKEERIELNKRNKNNYLCTPVDLTPIDKDELPPRTAIGFITEKRTSIYFNKLAENGTVIPWGETLIDTITFADNLNLVDGEYFYVSGGSEMNGHSDNSAHYYNMGLDFSIMSADNKKIITGSGAHDNILKALQGTGFTHIINYPGTHRHLQRTGHNILESSDHYLISNGVNNSGSH
ncbi:MAG: hypothetical protein K0U66_00355, partial [Gammaproteobacteria bacterium]|nr:hypothetical protein [Gammaproteobacteria bacterium]